MGKKHRAKKNSKHRGPAKIKAGPSQTPPGADRYLIAVHETGHAVARQKLFGDLKQVVVSDKGTGFAQPTTVVNICNSSRTQLVDELIVVVAGHAAECLFAANRPGFAQGLAADRQQAASIVKIGEFSDEDVFLVCQYTTDFVAAYEPEIKAVADKLNRYGRLWGDTVAAISAAARATVESETVA